MARIPQAELEQLKQNVPLEQLVHARGIELVRHGQDLIGLCPFHNDKTPSLVISPNKNLWHCLGACQAGGSVIDWMMKAEGVSFRHAVELLRNDTPSSLAATNKRIVRYSTIPKLKPVLERDADDQALLHQVVDYYHATLKQSPEALAYLDKRGLHSSEMIDRFKLGFANRTLGYRLPAKNRAAGTQIRGQLERLGILRSSGHEHFRGSFVIPVLDENGNVLEMYGRKINDHLRKGTPNHLYLPGPHRGVFNIEALRASDEIILCESLIDALTFWCAGFRNVTASYGIQGFTEDHMDALARHRTRRVSIAYDRDGAGEEAAAKLSETLRAHGTECFRINFPPGMDANAYALSVTPANESLGVAIQNAIGLGEGPSPAAAKNAVDAHEPSASTEISTRTEPPQPDLLAESSFPLAASSNEPLNKTNSIEAATPALAPPTSSLQTEVQGDEIIIRLGDRRWRIRGLAKNMSFDQLKVNILCGRNDAFHVDIFDLYAARQRQAYIKLAATELNLEEKVIKTDLGRVLLEVEALQEAQIKKALEPENPVVTLTDAERQRALTFLKAPDLVNQILHSFAACGVVGEETNKLIGYLAAVSRKLDAPLAVVIQSSSAAGKSSLMDAVLALMPAEERVKYSAMTGQSLFYMGENNLKHKILAIAEEEGAERATYALKLLQSEGELTIASTGKDPTTGRLVTHEYHVEGPVAIFLTTTAIEIDEELLNRCVLLTIDEDRSQTRAIHRVQRERETLKGLLAKEDQKAIVELHQNAQRLLESLAVINPYAERLTFADERTRMRRDQAKYLSLIRTITLLHQHQRSVHQIEHRGEKRSYIETAIEDIELANNLAHEVFGRSLDELPPQTRRFLDLMHGMVSEACKAQQIKRVDFRFTRRQALDFTGWSLTQVRMHLGRLIEYEYVIVHRGGRGQQFVYELFYDGEGRDGQPFMPGLIDVESLKPTQSNSTTSNLAGENGELAGSWRPHGGGLAAGWRSTKTNTTTPTEPTHDQSRVLPSKAHCSGVSESSESYVPTRRKPVSPEKLVESLAARVEPVGAE